MLDVVPQNQAITWVASIAASSYEANDICPEKHLSDSDTTFEVY